MRKAIFVTKDIDEDNLNELNDLLSQGWNVINMCAAPITPSTGDEYNHVYGAAVFLVVLEN